MPRPEHLVLVSGTGTDVGKTWVGAQVLRRLRDRGVSVAARKPVQSFKGADCATDADVLAEATGERPEEVCPPHRWLPLPMAPPMAAAALGRPPVLLAELVGELRWPEGVDVGLVEGVGGARSPLADDGDTVDLAERLEPDLVVVVADPGLGTINAVRLASGAFAGVRIAVVLSRYDETCDLHRRNAEWLRSVDGLTVATTVEELVALL